MSAPFDIDALLAAAGAATVAGAEEREPWTSNPPGDDAWPRLEAFLQERAEVQLRGDEPPGLPSDLADLLVERPELRRAYAALAVPVSQAHAGLLPVTDSLAPALREAIQEATRAAAQETESAPGMGMLLAATLSYAAEKWHALQVAGFELIQPELLLARNPADAPIAMQGCLADRYLVALSLSGDPSQGAAAFDLQCQEIRPGAASPRPVPAFCLLSEDGKRYHSRDRIARVDAVGSGRHVFTLEVVGRKTGTLVVDIAE